MNCGNSHTERTMLFIDPPMHEYFVRNKNLEIAESVASEFEFCFPFFDFSFVFVLYFVVVVVVCVWCKWLPLTNVLVGIVRFDAIVDGALQWSWETRHKGVGAVAAFISVLQIGIAWERLSKVLRPMHGNLLRRIGSYGQNTVRSLDALVHLAQQWIWCVANFLGFVIEVLMAEWERQKDTW